MLAACFTLLLFSPPLFFDRLILKDGRIIEGEILASDDPGYQVLRLPGADIPIRADLIERTYIENMEAYVPKSKAEEEHLKKGWVLFEGSWMSRTRREQALTKRAEADKQAITKLREEQRWRNAKTRQTLYFEVRSNATQAVMDDYTNRLDNFYKYFLADWNIVISQSARRTKPKFFLYRNYRDFLDVTGTRFGVGGFFNFVDGELHLYHDDKRPEETIGTLYHEGNHLLTWLIEPSFRYPIWMNEGMAEYYGAVKIGPRGEFVLGGLQYDRIVSLRNDELRGNSIPLREMMLTPQGSFGARHYAVTWSFIHFLMESPQYGRRFKLFFGNLSKNRDIQVTVKSYSNITGGLREPSLPSVVTAFEKAMGKSLTELEAEWKDFTAQTYGTLTAGAYYLAARIAMRSPDELTEEMVILAKEYFEKAIELGIQDANCYRDFAELLRKGGVSEASTIIMPWKPDPVRGWEMIEKAIDLDPIEPLNYCEAAGLLILDGPLQDLDRGEALVKTARALDARNWQVQLLTSELMSLIEPARERRRKAAELEQELASIDRRVWVVQPFYYENQPKPEHIPNLSTEALKDLIATGVVTENDWVFQSWQPDDPATGETTPGTNPWDKEWVLLKEVPVFAEALAAAREESGAGG